MAQRTAVLIAAWLGCAQLAGCGAVRQPGTGQQIAAAPGPEQPYRTVGGKRYISGPYGSARDVTAVISMIEHHSVPQQLSVRGVDLPDVPAYSFISVYRHTFPKDCGALRFQLFKGDGIEILEYDDRQVGTTPVKIRDYVQGPGPFVGPGLWGPYDSTSNAPVILLPGSARQGGMGLMKGTYAIGWVTTLSPTQQVTLGKDYQQAVRRAAQCVR
ncbi:MAG: hypothetical protein WCC36_14070 [Gammaproteobacteria bacterium]